jgi:Mg-chelatase subunit ChlD
MATANKTIATRNIENMRPLDCTNLWHGIREGIKLFPASQDGRVPAIMVLTDGQPNHMQVALK